MQFTEQQTQETNEFALAMIEKAELVQYDTWEKTIHYYTGFADWLDKNGTLSPKQCRDMVEGAKLNKEIAVPKIIADRAKKVANYKLPKGIKIKQRTTVAPKTVFLEEEGASITISKEDLRKLVYGVATLSHRVAKKDLKDQADDLTNHAWETFREV